MGVSRKRKYLDDIINIADQAYSSDGLVRQAADGKKPGDTLAEFIANELDDTFDNTKHVVHQLEEAMRAMELALRELGDVHQALSEARVQCKKIAVSNDLPLLIGKFTSPIAQKYLEERLKCPRLASSSRRRGT